MPGTLREGHPTTVWGAPAASASLAMLAVHGRGQDPGFMRSLFERGAFAGVRFYAPAAARSSWYPHPFLDDIERNEPARSSSLDTLTTTLAAMRADGFADDRIVLAGFSQGACLVSELLLHDPRAYAATVILTGGYLGPAVRQPLSGSPLARMPALLRSVEGDPWVPPSRVRQTANVLGASGATVDLRIEPGAEHVVSAASVADVAALLARLAQEAWR